MARPFSTEEELVRAFLYDPPINEISRYKEWTRWEGLEINGLFGIPDVVIAFGKVQLSGKKIIHAFSFELKLRNWKRALVQAYRYAAFSHYSLVVMDHAHIRPALANIHLFEKANIGLLSLDTERNITWFYRPEFQIPYSEQLFRSLLNQLEPKLFGDQIHEVYQTIENQ